MDTTEDTLDVRAFVAWMINDQDRIGSRRLLTATSDLGETVVREAVLLTGLFLPESEMAYTLRAQVNKHSQEILDCLYRAEKGEPCRAEDLAFLKSD